MANIVLKDRLGEQQTYEGVEQVKLNTSDGGVQIFTAGETEEKTVELDFSDGGVEVTPNEGKLLSKVGIPVPANLTPENIAEGVDIAGIIGTLAASGGGGKVKYVTKYNFSMTAGVTNYIDHNLGVVPDIVFCTVGANAKSGYVIDSFGISKALADKLGISPFNFCTYWHSSTKIQTNYSSSEGIETTKESCPICFATTTRVGFNGKNAGCLGMCNQFIQAYIFAGLT